MKIDLLKYKRKIKKIMKYYVVWWIAFLWNTCIMYFVSDFLGWYYGYAIAIIFLYNISIIFFLQKRFTFWNKTNTKSQFYKFILYTIFNLVVTFVLLPYLKQYIGWSYTFTFVVLSLIITIINFVIQNYLIFYEKQNDF